jgi:peptidoglycan/LPS O-acetylase OafA/YrhL
VSHQEVIFTQGQIFANLFYLQELLGYSSINPVAWTLCIELQLYLFFVFILSLFFQIYRAKYLEDQINLIQSIPFALFFTLLLIVSLSYSHFNLDWTPKGLFFPYWYSFFLGAAVCWTTIDRMAKHWLYLYFGLIALCLAFHFDEQMLMSLMIALVIYGIGQLDYLKTWSGSRLFQYLGKISFSLYLMHWLVGSNCINFLAKRVGELTMVKFSLIYLVSIGLSIFIAHLFYRWVEQPSLKWSQRFGKFNRLIPSVEGTSNPRQ